MLLHRFQREREREHPRQPAVPDGAVRKQLGGPRRGKDFGLPRGEEKVRRAPVSAAAEVSKRTLRPRFRKTV